jgi:hypothetical protein
MRLTSVLKPLKKLFAAIRDRSQPGSSKSGSNYSDVYAQQGRVASDSDWNEQLDIAERETEHPLPCIRININGEKWREVKSLSGTGREDRVYAVQQTVDGSSLLLFGDGMHGKMPPSGIASIVATYRSGAGAEGGVQADFVYTENVKRVAHAKTIKKTH